MIDDPEGDEDRDEEEARRVGAPVLPRNSVLRDDFTLPNGSNVFAVYDAALSAADFATWAKMLGYRAFARVLIPLLSAGGLAGALLAPDESFCQFLGLELFGAFAAVAAGPYFLFYGRRLGRRFQIPALVVVIGLIVWARFSHGLRMHALLELSIGFALPIGVEEWLKWLPRWARAAASGLEARMRDDASSSGDRMPGGPSL